MILDVYRGIIPNFAPSQSHIESYSKLLDRDGDGTITLEDMETTVAKYFCDVVEEDNDAMSMRDAKSTMNLRY